MKFDEQNVSCNFSSQISSLQLSTLSKCMLKTNKKCLQNALGGCFGCSFLSVCVGFFWVCVCLFEFAFFFFFCRIGVGIPLQAKISEETLKNLIKSIFLYNYISQ